MTEERIQELREQSERGRKYKIAAEIFESFFSDIRKEAINQLETERYDDDTHPPYDTLAILRTIRYFKDVCKTQMDLGEIAERELSEYGEQ